MEDLGEMSDYELNRRWASFSDKDIKTILRDIKLRVILGDLSFKIDKSKLKNMPLSIIRDRYPNAIISGSNSLLAYGLLNRNCADFDIIVDEVPDVKLYDISTTTSEADNRIGYCEFSIEPRGFLGIPLLIKQFFNKEKIVNVDFFLNMGKSEFEEIEYEGYVYKFHSPMQILEKKCLMIKSIDKTSYFRVNVEKHLLDIARFAHNIKYYE